MTPSKVLIVDDSVANLRVLGELLEGAGYDIRVATSGEQAFEMAKAEPPDIVLLDVRLPGGWSGHEVCRQLKADKSVAEIPVIFMTAFGDEADEATCLELGAVDFVMRPFRLPVVLRRVANHLAYRSVQNQLKEQASTLERLVTRRTDELKAANDRLTRLDAAKTVYLRLLAQELRAPAEGLVGIGELALQSIENEGKRERLRGLFRTQKERLDYLFGQYERLIDWQSTESEARRKAPPVRLDELLAQAWNLQAAAMESRRVIMPTGPLGSLLVQSEPRLLRSVLDGLTGWMSGMAAEGSRLSARYEDADEARVIWELEGNWAEFGASTLSQLAEKGLSSPKERGWLPLIDTIVDALGGSVTILSRGTGLEVALRLPSYRGS